MNSTVGVRSFWVGLWGLCSLGAMACTPRSVPPSGPPTIQSSDGAQTVARLLQHMQTLASDDFGGRAPGTAGEQRTVHYIVDALRALGLRGHTAHRMARRWRDHEERALEDMAAMWARDEARTNLFARLRQALEEAERIMRDEDPRVAAAQEPGWDNEAVRATRRPDEAEPPA